MARDPLFGRDRELAALQAAIEDGAPALVVGGYGVGKTRLAEVAASAFTAAGERSAYVASLEGTKTAGEARDRIARAIGASVTSDGERAGRALTRAIQARGETLIVLDGCDAVADLAALLASLAGASEARWVFTSRRRLDLAGAIVIELGPLAIEAAVALFVARACVVKHDFALAPGDDALVAEIVRTLDGNPFAIELAASRAHVMAPRVLLHRLGSRFDVLKKGRASEQLSLEAAIEGACRALAPHEREALALFSVFRGGFDLDAADAVLGLASGASLDVVQSLRDASLLVATDDVRLTLPESVRAYAIERLGDRAALEAAHERHAAYFAAFAENETREPRLAREHDNLLAVVDRVLGREDVTPRRAEPALRVLLALAPIVLSRGPLEKYATLLAPAIDATLHSGARPDLIARSLVLRASLARHLGRLGDATRDLARAGALARTLGSRAIDAEIAIEAARAATGHAEAASLLDGALAFAREEARRDLEARALVALAAIHVQQDRLVEARIDLERAAPLHARSGATLAAAGALADLGHVLLELGDDLEAGTRLRESLAQAQARDDAYGIAVARLRLGLLALASGGEARSDLASAERAFGELGYRVEEAFATGYSGVAARIAGRVGEAYAALSHACDRLRELEHVQGHAIFAVHRAGLDADVGRHDAAREALLALRAPSQLASALLTIERDRTETPSFERRLDVRLLRRCHERGITPTPVPAGAMLVASDGAWFRLPNGPRVVLSRRPTLMRVLARLATARLDAPGDPLDWEALLEAAWPSERVIPEAGAHRVRVAISTLRKLGLKDALETVEDGYRLTRTLPFERVES